MKAIRVHQFGEPEVMQLEDVADVRPSAHQIVVRVHAAGVNPVDTYIRSGMYGQRPLPYTPGSDAAGIVESRGEGVTKNIKMGDRVYISGTASGAYAELALCEESQVHPLPEHVSFAQGASVGVPYATAYRALFHRAQAQAGETVLVHGATGGVGLAAVQIARGAGLIVIGTGGTEAGRNTVKEQGAQHVLDHRAPDYLQRIAEITKGEGVNVILEMLANMNLGNDLTLLSRKGRVVVIGSRGRVEIDPRDAMGRDANVLGMSLFNADEDELSSIHHAIVAGLENETLRPVINREMPLADAQHAHRAVLEAGAHGKIVLIP
ncbi:MAG: NADPH:quinone reductase [Pyrinomonadaceae bacterium]|nr:NADPH:quinone reductase [Pyrinomonadaceae bacterium]